MDKIEKIKAKYLNKYIKLTNKANGSEPERNQYRYISNIELVDIPVCAEDLSAASSFVKFSGFGFYSLKELGVFGLNNNGSDMIGLDAADEEGNFDELSVISHIEFVKAFTEFQNEQVKALNSTDFKD